MSDIEHESRALYWLGGGVSILAVQAVEYMFGWTLPEPYFEYVATASGVTLLLIGAWVSLRSPTQGSEVVDT